MAEISKVKIGNTQYDLHAKKLTHSRYKLTTSDTVTDVYGDGHAYQITIAADFANYAEHIHSMGSFCFDLSAVLATKPVVSVDGFKVTYSNGKYTLVGDCTVMDVWYHFTITSTSWPTS